MKTIFVHGGSRGSKFINGLIKELAPKLLTDFKVHHQTGEADYQEMVAFRKSLPDNLRDNYVVDPYLLADKWVDSLREADVVVGRAGANVCSELLVLKKPAILIPLRYSYLNEQYENAKVLENLGVAEVIEQKKATSELLYQTIIKMDKNLVQYQNAFLGYINPDLKAADNLLDLVLKVARL